MGFFRPILILLGCVAAFGANPAGPTSASYTYGSSLSFPNLAAYIQSPCHMPPAPEPLAMAFDETEIDEEDTEANDSLLAGGFALDLDGGIVQMSMSSFLPECFSHLTISVSPVRRC
jgi:hypothetical protein